MPRGEGISVWVCLCAVGVLIRPLLADPLLQKDPEALFLDWLKNERIDYPQLVFSSKDCEFVPICLRAATDLKEGDVLFSVPLKSLLHSRMFFPDESPDSIMSENADTNALALSLLLDAANATSPRAPWLQFLEKTPRTSLTVHPDSLASFSGSAQLLVESSRRQVGQSLAGLREYLAEHHPGLYGDGKWLTPERWLWALTTVSAHSFPASIQTVDAGPLRLTLFVPLLPQIPHRFVNTTYKLEQDRLVVATGTPFPKGAQVFINRGEQLTNAQLLMRYGYALEGNPNDEVPLTLNFTAALVGSAPTMDLVSEFRLRILQAAGLCTPDGVGVFGVRAGILPYRLLVALRITLLGASQLDQAAGVLNGTMVSLENELAVLQLLTNLLRSTIEAAPTAAGYPYESKWRYQHKQSLLKSKRSKQIFKRVPLLRRWWNQ
ncbi:hypothetical protein PAPYR_4681 [Paratrimastix pyriformis]|uniref:Rubisco LSMT substrate-binding domain-containing protein n=1 Tax=Paratrimastix pyriformis TaxID=342808 RepID=A0ABQ8UNT8_9EUKA|nr:hypothetical protein PAPYR_4681 [Paratrimastix pyriformis]